MSTTWRLLPRSFQLLEANTRRPFAHLVNLDKKGLLRVCVCCVYTTWLCPEMINMVQKEAKVNPSAGVISCYLLYSLGLVVWGHFKLFLEIQTSVALEPKREVPTHKQAHPPHPAGSPRIFPGISGFLEKTWCHLMVPLDSRYIYHDPWRVNSITNSSTTEPKFELLALTGVYDKHIHTYIHTYVRTYIHTYIHTDRQTDRQTDRHTYIHTCMHTCMPVPLGCEQKVVDRFPCGTCISTAAIEIIDVAGDAEDFAPPPALGVSGGPIVFCQLSRK